LKPKRKLDLLLQVNILFFLNSQTYISLKKALRFIFGALLFVSGEYLGYRLFTNDNQSSLIGLLGILAVLMTFIGMALILEIPYLYLNRLYHKKMVTNKVIANIVCIPMLVLIISSFVIPVMVYTHHSHKYHKEQINKYGVMQDIIIENESHGKNSNNYSDFSFYHNGKKWRGSLRTWNYRLGDSAKIIYSSQNPNEMEWYEKYLKQKNEN
jgi:hypothetical protein